MLDFSQLLPHCKKDSKLDTKSQRNVINEVADMKVQILHLQILATVTPQVLDSNERLLSLQGCSSVVFFEARKHQDYYLWLAKSPDGPSMKFLCTNGAASEPFSSLLTLLC